MALTLRSKTPVRFELSDGLAETTITLYGDDSPDVLVEKLKRVVAMADGPRLLPQAPVAPVSEPVAGNGWQQMALAAPELPEDRRADWELIQAEEQQ